MHEYASGIILISFLLGDISLIIKNELDSEEPTISLRIDIPTLYALGAVAPNFFNWSVKDNINFPSFTKKREPITSTLPCTLSSL